MTVTFDINNSSCSLVSCASIRSAVRPPTIILIKNHQTRLTVENTCVSMACPPVRGDNPSALACPPASTWRKSRALACPSVRGDNPRALACPPVRGENPRALACPPVRGENPRALACQPVSTWRIPRALACPPIRGDNQRVLACPSVSTWRKSTSIGLSVCQYVEKFHEPWLVRPPVRGEIPRVLAYPPVRGENHRALACPPASTWRKSTRIDLSACQYMEKIHMPASTWRKSTSLGLSAGRYVEKIHERWLVRLSVRG